MNSNSNELQRVINLVLSERKLKNHSYSLRALARDLSLDPGQLQRIISSKMAPTPLVAYRVGKHLNYNSDDVLKLIESTLDD